MGHEYSCLAFEITHLIMVRNIQIMCILRCLQVNDKYNYQNTINEIKAYKKPTNMYTVN